MNSTIKKTTLFLGACMAFQLGGIPQMLAAPSTSMEVMQQTKRITGTVKDATGMEVIGANVIVKGTWTFLVPRSNGISLTGKEGNSVNEVDYFADTGLSCFNFLLRSADGYVLRSEYL